VRATPEQIRRRRLVALTVVVAAVVTAVAAVAVALPRATNETPTTTAVAFPPPPKPFRIVFPEGFTRAQMAGRVAAVAKIAERKKGKNVALAERPYVKATATVSVPCFTPRRRANVEGFLFPAT